MPQKSKVIRGSGPLKTKFNLPGIKKLLLPRPADTDSMGTSVPARALFGPPPETAVAEKRSSLVDFLKQVTLFEDLSRWDLRRLARMSRARLPRRRVHLPGRKTRRGALCPAARPGRGREAGQHSSPRSRISLPVEMHGTA